MATNPNAIFGEALATGPRQIPLSDLLTQQAQRQNIQSEIAQRAQETQGLAQQNTLRQRQIADEQAVRDAIAKHTTSIPVTAPSANIPTPGTDSDGNPLPLDLGYHQIAAKAAVQAPHTDYDGVYADLNSQGRWAAADTLRRSIQERRAKDLDNSKAQMAVYEDQNKRRNELSASVVNAPPEQQAAIAAQVGPQLEQEQLIPPGSGASFGPNEASILYRSSSGAGEPIRQARATLEGIEAETGLRKAQTEVATETAAAAKISRQAAEQFLTNPDAELGPGGRIEKLGLPPKDTQRLKNQVTDIWQSPGTPEDKVKAVAKAKQDAIDANRRMEQTIAEKSIPTVATQQAREFNEERRSDRSYQLNSAQLEKVAAPVRTLQTRLTSLQDTLDQNSPAADAAVGAQLLGIINGGQGGRMNAAMAERLVGGRSAWQGLLAAAQHWNPDPNAANSITDNQRQQVRALAKAFQDRVTAKSKIVEDARAALDGTDDIGQHRRIVTKAQSDLDAADRPTSTAPTTTTGQTFDVTDPTGTVHHFPTQAAANTFKRLAKIP